MAYAAKTEVPFERSVGEIVGLLRKAGADQIGQMERRNSFTLQFTMSDRMVRFRVHFPTPDEIAVMTGPRQDQARVSEQWRRQRGRALLLVIKAKLESVESEVETFEQAFLANVVLADGATLYDRVREPIALEYQTGTPNVMLLEGPSA
jgi:hypothetical protein